jgi:hypothetical protein
MYKVGTGLIDVFAFGARIFCLFGLFGKYFIVGKRDCFFCLLLLLLVKARS